MADAPEFSIDNSFEREQIYLPGDWNVVDTYTQNYKLDWDEEYSSRLAVQMTLEIEAEDIIRSLDVDEKHITPSLELDLTGLVWDLNFLIEDTIDYSNEFNTPRKDTLEFGLDMELSPLYLPPVKAQLQRLIDSQDGLEDKTEDKVDISTDYEFGDFFDIDASWKEEDLDDRLFDDNDISSREWDFNLNYGQALTPAFKVDFQSGLTRSREETRNNAGVLLLVDTEHEFDAALKFTLETFPEFMTELEVTTVKDLALNGDEDEATLSVEYNQILVDLGTLTENLDLGRKTVSSPTEETDEDSFGFNVELAGTPYKYTDYSIKYTFEVEDLTDEIDPANTKRTEDQEFDLSLTIEPNEKMTIDTSYNLSTTRENNVKTASENTLKIESIFDGEILDVPNLTFTPSLEISTEKAFADDTDTNIFDLELEFIYEFVLPLNMTWELETVYNFEKKDGVLTRELDFTSDLDVDLITSTWEFTFGHVASTTIYYDSEDSVFWDHEFDLGAHRELTPRITLDAEYKYEFMGDEENSDEFETNLEWQGRNSTLAFKVVNDRVFEGPRDVERTYEAEFTMEF